jgi:fluoride exporter
LLHGPQRQEIAARKSGKNRAENEPAEEALKKALEKERVRIIFLIVFGALGTLARYGLDGWIQYRVGSVFPAGTLTINLLGCLFLGLIGQFGLNHISVSPDLRIGLTIGLMGGFTTFSTFGWDTVRMLQEGEWTKASIYVGASVLGGLMAMILGMRVGGSL